MESRGWWNEEAEARLKADLKAEVMQCFKQAEALKRCELGELFTDIYGGEEPWNIVSVNSSLGVSQFPHVSIMCLRKSNERSSLGCSRSMDKYGNRGVQSL